MDFGLIPPEVNSGLMYTGPGPESMLAAAAAWDGLATELTSAAASYGSVVSALVFEPWMGPAARAMAAAATPHAAWLAATAAQVKETASQARAAAAAFESAIAAMVPPPLIAANRNRLMSLVATNALGQNSTAIAAAQAEYAEMWALDAATMYSYSGASAAAAALAPFTEPAQGTDAAGAAAEAAAVARAANASAATNVPTAPTSADPVPSEGITGIPSAPNQVLPAAPVAIPTPIGELDAFALYISAIASGSFALALTNTFRPWSFEHDTGSGGLGPTQGHAVSSTRDQHETDSGRFGGAAPVSAETGHATWVGALSVPHSWTTAAPEIRLAVEAMPSASASPGAETIALNGMPAGLLGGMALASMAGRSTGTEASTRTDNTTEHQEGRKPPVVVIREPPPTTTPAPPGG